MAKIADRRARAIGRWTPRVIMGQPRSRSTAARYMSPMGGTSEDR
jgi:hypothetical protein